MASIQWQKQHYRNSDAGRAIQQLADALQPSTEARHPFSVRLYGASEASHSFGPYHLIPVWDDIRKSLKVEVSNDRIYTPDSKPLLTFEIPAQTIAHESKEFTAEDGSLNQRNRARTTGANMLRDHLIHKNITVSDSLAAALFEAIASLSQPQQYRGM